ncbi:MAG: LPS assembly lipoprotein LptE [Hymenobacteraceae bacterium]|nr:LPS assembly lipoprotein LptE [Hymenobacteraceae bacterium]MDX5443805.1 LPS assembly lipoprotein LptE [Hymenobacteraceae bacterium]MDX5513455.1 LPS assembly lipoprotein LptE [Hymenobacteraceae bacterium]
MLLVLAISVSSCGVYSFSGANLSPDIKTISIQNFENSSGEGPANLTQIVTENFKQFYLRNSTLNLARQDGDLQLEGRITGFTVSPAAIQRVDGIDQAAQNRLTITIQVNYVNNKDPKQNFNQTFSAFEDFPQDQNLTQLPQSFIDRIVERIISDVFNRTVANW